MKQNKNLNRRILIIDDNANIHEDFRSILEYDHNRDDSLAEEKSALFGLTSKSSDYEGFEVDSAFQGSEGLEKVVLSVKEGRPYAMAFVDMRMPPGWDGVKTIQQLWNAYPDLEVVICTAYSDYLWHEIIEQLKQSDKLLILKKPYDSTEVLQLATALTTKWHLARQASISHKELEQKVVERTRDLESANIKRQAAEKANTIKTEFLSNISHELRTPLHIILSFSGLGIEKCDIGERAKLLDYFSKINRTGNELLDLLNDLLDLAQLESDNVTFQFEPANLAMLINTLVDEFKSITSKRNINIHTEGFDSDEIMNIDIKKIKQLVRNILMNAVKYSPDGGEIKVVIQYVDGSVFVSVSDEGPGIPEDELELIFDKFEQSSKTKSGVGGTGLGLAICKEIITAHKGRIWAKNRRRGGAIFAFEIPLIDEGRKVINQALTEDAGNEFNVSCQAVTDDGGNEFYASYPAVKDS